MKSTINAIEERITINHANTLAFIACLRASQTPTPYRDVEQLVAQEPAMNLSIQSPHTLVQVLLDCGALEAHPVEERGKTEEIKNANSMPVDENACADLLSMSTMHDHPVTIAEESTSHSKISPVTTVDGSSSNPSVAATSDRPVADTTHQPAEGTADAQPIDYLIVATPEGAEILDRFDPVRRLLALLASEPEAYRALYLKTLTRCITGATLTDLKQLLGDEPALHFPKRIYPEYFVSKLETVDGLTWNGSWITTDAGKQVLSHEG